LAKKPSHATVPLNNKETAIVIFCDIRKLSFLYSYHSILLRKLQKIDIKNLFNCFILLNRVQGMYITSDG
jgi:hypothetical protein